MSQPPYILREAKPSDLEAINSLFQIVFGFSKPLTHDRWKFHENPTSDPLIIVAEDKGKIIGQYALLPTPLQCGSEKILGAQSLDTMTHPDYRGKGIFVALANSCFELAAKRGVEVLYGIPNANSYPGFIRRLNWDHVGNIRMYVRPVHLASFKRIPKIFGMIADLFLNFWPLASAGDFSFSYVRPSVTELDQMLKTEPEEKDSCSIQRSGQWLHWRFSTDSMRNYEWIVAKKSGTPVACAIWFVNPYGTGSLSEFVGGDISALKAVTGEVLRRAKKKSVGVVKTVTNYPLHLTALKRNGFISYKSLPLISRSMTARTLGSNIHHFPAWKISASAIDTY